MVSPILSSVQSESGLLLPRSCFNRVRLLAAPWTVILLSTLYQILEAPVCGFADRPVYFLAVRPRCRLCCWPVTGGHPSCSVRASLRSGSLHYGALARGTRASVVVAHGLSCSKTCGICPGQGSNPCPLRWREDSSLLDHQESPICFWF